MSQKLDNSNIGFDEFILKNRIFIALILIGLIFIGIGVFIIRNDTFSGTPDIEVLEAITPIQDDNSGLVVEISGAVEKPGVYRLTTGSRLEDLLISAGGISAKADRQWIEKYINRAAKLSDGQKVYIPVKNEQIDASSANNYQDENSQLMTKDVNQTIFVNINTATQKELESLPGIGPVYAQNIIEYRPYSSVDELSSRGVLKNYVYEKIKNYITIY